MLFRRSTDISSIDCSLRTFASLRLCVKLLFRSSRLSSRLSLSDLVVQNPCLHAVAMLELTLLPLEMNVDGF